MRTRLLPLVMVLMLALWPVVCSCHAAAEVSGREAGGCCGGFPVQPSEGESPARENPEGRPGCCCTEFTPPLELRATVDAPAPEPMGLPLVEVDPPVGAVSAMGCVLPRIGPWPAPVTLLGLHCALIE
jgi:hypothetical protein